MTRIFVFPIITILIVSLMVGYSNKLTSLHQTNAEFVPLHTGFKISESGNKCTLINQQTSQS